MLSKIKLIGVDIDGTLTDGKLYYIEGMNEPLKTFNVKDGMAVYLAKKAGIKIAIISGLNSRASEKRARKLGIEDAFFGVMEKAPIMRKIMEKYGLKKGEAIFLGDDIQDIPAMDEAGLGAAVSDAVEEVKKRAEIILGSKGGEGALRELVELILRNRK
ncbi:MAG: HAD hydrolase family protein [Candidatus Aminicenantes bacterium]|nr:HAD hydrolase family protein [Candidatus Aminicenantes bacterium]